MSCSRALVLMATVNRTCATRSWVEGQEETSEKADRGRLTRSVPPRGSSVEGRCYRPQGGSEADMLTFTVEPLPAAWGMGAALML